MNANTLRKLIKAVKVIALILPIIAVAVSMAGSSNKPGGDPISDDPVPF